MLFKIELHFKRGKQMSRRKILKQIDEHKFSSTLTSQQASPTKKYRLFKWHQAPISKPS
jgi:hypothetical protein